MLTVARSGLVFVETPELSGDSIFYLVSEKAVRLNGGCTWNLPEMLTMNDGIVAGDKLISKFVF